MRGPVEAVRLPARQQRLPHAGPPPPAAEEPA